MLNLKPGFGWFTFLLLISLPLALNPAIAQDLDGPAKSKPAAAASEPSAEAERHGPVGDKGGGGRGGFGSDMTYYELQQARRELQTSELIISWSAENDELRGFSVKLGTWSNLSVPKQKKVVPVVAGDVAAVRIGDEMAGYSARNGKWDVLTLSQNSMAVPVVRPGLVQVRDGELSYTFAASTGRWTSPTDDSLNFEWRKISLKHVLWEAALKHVQGKFDGVQFRGAGAPGGFGELQASGRRGRLDAVEQKLKEIDTPRNAKLWNAEFDSPRNEIAKKRQREAPGKVAGTNAGPDVFSPLPSAFRRPSTTTHPAEQQSLSLAQTLRKGDGVSRKEKQQLRELVQAALDAKLQQQTKQVEQLRTKLQRVEQQLEARQESRERIVERRVEELLDPEIDWQSLSGVPSRPPIPGVTRTPIGLPGPPHLPLGQPARVASVADEPTAAAADEALAQHMKSQYASGGKPDDSSNIVEKLINRRREAERGLRRLRDSLQKLNQIRHHFGETPSEPGSLMDRDLRRAEKSAQQHQQDLKNLIAEWRLVWRNYESQVRLLKVASENAQTSVEFAEQAAAMQKQLFLTGAAPSEKAQAAAHEVQQATAAAKYAKERLSALEAVAKDAPHLNPDNFDTEETLKMVIAESDDDE
ncbi:hypothetical protein [Fuerstiella marisgermanici]|uniref:Uncharacterized protein n=1 Tax=Fuerstiella marisgermanici TaxID=1891926 RepID=A0A1P8WBS3_9PLAN|nr:hypothetical protein [Fuerstiella marisgermanici]APZ91496.1 hypothetical protein Fuma_01084 [Fuerstiella marisgermanici]